MQKEVQRTLHTLKSHQVSPELVKELETNILLLDQMHTEVMRDQNHMPSYDDLGKRAFQDSYPSSTQTLADIIDDAYSGSAMISKKIISNSLALPARTSKNGTLMQRKKGGHQWSDEDRKALFNGMRLFGTDFSMISATTLAHKSQKEVLKRFQREDRINPDLVIKSLQWNMENKNKLQKGFSRVLKALNIDVDNFDPLNFSLNPPDRDDDIKPLEYYLLNLPQ